MEKALLDTLLRKYREGKTTAEETAFVEAWYAALACRRDDGGIGQSQPSPETWDAIGREIAARIDAPAPRPRVHRLWPKIAAAAAVLLALGAGLFLLVGRNQPQPGTRTAQAANIVPGKQAATLTLADGRTIRLSDSLQGEIARQQGVSVTRTGAGQLVYTSGEGELPADQFHTLSTGPGEMYRIQLPDGTTVWLNAASSLTYAPGTFSVNGDPLRKVRLSGEAYFEVSRNKHRPFVVQSAAQEVEVLGTHFNVSAYPDDRATTSTLLEGSVKVSPAGDTKAGVLLAPNQQAVLKGGAIKVNEVDAQSAVAWKNGYFDFNYATLESIMTGLGRWYAVRVVYEDASVKGITFLGSIGRYEKVSKILDLLERTDQVSFRIDGNTIYVRKKSTSH